MQALRGVLRQFAVRERPRSARGAAAQNGSRPVEPSGRFTEQERVLEDLVVRGWLSGPDGPDARARLRRPPPPSSRSPSTAGTSATGIEVPLHRGNVRDGRRAPGRPPVDVLAVGHYVAVKPQYAEAALDEAISAPLPAPALGTPDDGWLITQLTMRGTITGDLGQPFLLPDGRDRAGRLVAVVGLGLPGRLGQGELTLAVREPAGRSDGSGASTWRPSFSAAAWAACPRSRRWTRGRTGWRRRSPVRIRAPRGCAA